MMFANAEDVEADLMGKPISSSIRCMRSTGLSVRPVAGSEIAAAKLSIQSAFTFLLQEDFH